MARCHHEDPLGCHQDTFMACIMDVWVTPLPMSGQERGGQNGGTLKGLFSICVTHMWPLSTDPQTHVAVPTTEQGWPARRKKPDIQGGATPTIQSQSDLYSWFIPHLSQWLHSHKHSPLEFDFPILVSSPLTDISTPAISAGMGGATLPPNAATWEKSLPPSDFNFPI